MESTPRVVRSALVLSGVSLRRLATSEALMALLPTLTEGAMTSGDIGFNARLASLAVEVRLEAQPKASRVRQRLAFWLARERGSSRAIEALAPSEAEQFYHLIDDSALCLRDVSPARWSEAVRRVFTAAGAEPPPGIPEEPELRLHIGGTGWNGFTFDPYARLLLVPSPLAPPPGDVLRVSIEPAGAPGERCGARATVVAIRCPAEAAPGSPAGFTIALDAGSLDASALLAARCPRPGTESTSRVSPRYPVVGGARLTSSGEDLSYESADEFVRDYMSNLSHGGAFVRTSRPRSIGDRVDLHLRLPGRGPIAIPAIVVHRDERGVGLQFEVTGAVEAALSAAVAGLAARPRRVLVIDDDGLVRRILSDAFAAHGFETITASNGDEGLRTIVDELFGLDAVVTDVHMPGLAGDALVSKVRQAGGEAELVLVAVTADWTDELAARLAASGAAEGVPKGDGPVPVVAAVLAAIARHSSRSEVGAPPRAVSLAAAMG